MSKIEQETANDAQTAEPNASGAPENGQASVKRTEDGDVYYGIPGVSQIVFRNGLDDPRYAEEIGWSGDSYFSMKALWARGWTKTMIERLLGREDDVWEAGHFLNRTGRRMFLRSRVALAEATPEFMDMFLRFAKRTGCTEEGVNFVLERCLRLRCEAEESGIEINVPFIPRRPLKRETFFPDFAAPAETYARNKGCSEADIEAAKARGREKARQQEHG